MPNLISFSATVTGDLGTDPEFVRWVMGRADAMAQAGAERAVKEHRILLYKWTHLPAFAITGSANYGLLIAERDVRVGGPDAWKWIQVNYGGPPVTINFAGQRRFMRFPFQGRGASYKAKSDGGGGERLGPIFVTQQVGLGPGGPRQIRARDFIGTVQQRKDVIFAAMEAAVNG